MAAMSLDAAKGPVVYSKGARRHLRPRPIPPIPNPLWSGAHSFPANLDRSHLTELSARAGVQWFDADKEAYGSASTKAEPMLQNVAYCRGQVVTLEGQYFALRPY
jgi:hypothetical protein